MIAEGKGKKRNKKAETKGQKPVARVDSEGLKTKRGQQGSARSE